LIAPSIAGALALAAIAAAADGGVATPAPTATPSTPTPAQAASTAPAPADASRLFLGTYAVDNRLAGSQFAAKRPEITLVFDAVAAGGTNELVRRLRTPIPADGRLVVAKTAYPPATEKPGRQHLRPSFLIDFDEPPVQSALAEARAQLGAKPSIDDLIRFVDKYITNKNWGRGYDIASIVAKRREGDCTEHAVLLAALARAFRFPARVVGGIVLLEAEGKILAFGHAWVEVHRAGRWQPADAAFTTRSELIYLPLELIVDEGPGFTLAMLKSGAGTIGVRRIALADRAP
jgi:transglutaminase-like putative cysteine protease